MNAGLAELKRQLEPDLGSAEAEWDAVRGILARFTADESAVLKWLFSEYAGYTETRARAGARYLELDPVDGWSILASLAGSNAPDDRDTALTILAASTDPRASELIRSLLNDPYPYLRLEAAGLLKSTYPGEVKLSLQGLAEHRQEWVRAAAQRMLLEMDRGVSGEAPG